MAIPSSGAISLSTIQTEFGGSNPISLSEYYAGGSYVPAGTTGTNGAVPSSGQISFSNFYGTQKAFEYWYTQYVKQTGATYTYTYAVGYDSSNNVYSGGPWRNFGTAYAQKADSGGNRQWTRILNWSTTSIYFEAGRVTSSGDFIGVGVYDNASKGLVVKWNSSGTLQWIRSIAGTTETLGLDVAVSSTGNIYAVLCDKYDVSKYYMSVVKFNSSGTLQWQRYVNGDSFNPRMTIAIDSSENVYASGTTYAPSNITGNWLYVLKYNSSGTLQWQKALQTTNYYNSNSYIFSNCDSSGNLIVCNPLYDASSNYAYNFNKISSAGSLTWTRKFSGSSISHEFRGVVCSGTDIYVALSTTVGGNFGRSSIAKYNSSGTLQYTRGYNISSTYYNGRGVATDGTYIYFGVGSITTAYQSGVTKTDMSLSQSIFSASTVTEAAGGNSLTSAGLTDSAGSLTVATGSSFTETSDTPASYVITQIT